MATKKATPATGKKSNEKELLKAAKAKAAEEKKAANNAKAKAFIKNELAPRFTPHYFSGTNNHGTDYAAAIAEGGELTVRIVKENFIDDVHGYGTEGVATGPVTEETAKLIAEGKAKQFFYEFE